MGDLRRDALSGRWVIIAPERAGRPVLITSGNGGEEQCPFCYGSERETPPELAVLGRPPGAKSDSPGWTVRVFPNKYPALGNDGSRPGGEASGAHEVIVETPNHNATLSSLSPGEIFDAIKVIKERVIFHGESKRIKYTQVFKNYRPPAGATIPHPHFQLLATPVIPTLIAEELNNARRYYRTKERCIYCDTVNGVLNGFDRMIEGDDDFVALVPFAPRFPYEIQLIPRFHRADFTEISDEEGMALAKRLKTVVRRIEIALDNPGYNLALHTAPVKDSGSVYYHWHIEIIPRITAPGGFEWGTDMFINPVSPEQAARRLAGITIDTED